MHTNREAIASTGQSPRAAFIGAFVAILAGCDSEQLNGTLYGRETNPTTKVLIVVHPGKPLIASTELVTSEQMPNGTIVEHRTAIPLRDVCNMPGVNCNGVNGNSAIQICIAPSHIDRRDFVELNTHSGDGPGWANFQLCPTNPNVGTSPHANWISCALNTGLLRVCANAE